MPEQEEVVLPQQFMIPVSALEFAFVRYSSAMATGLLVGDKNMAEKGHKALSMVLASMTPKDVADFMLRLIDLAATYGANEPEVLAADAIDRFTRRL
jgi:hypothetical protein